MARNKLGAFDVLGNIIIVKFFRDISIKDKKRFANNLLKRYKSVKTILEKSGKFKGRLRKQQTKWIAGEKTKEIIYRENNCVFRFNIDKTYFSPRLSNERKEIAEKIRKGEKVFVMFAGVAPYSVVIAKNSKAKIVYSNEINREANKYAELNTILNKVKDRVILLNGDIKNIANKIERSFLINNEKIPKQFDTIVMPRPQLKESFLREAFMLSKKGTKIYYYDFCKEDEIDGIIEKIKQEAKKVKKKIKISKIKNAGEIAPYKFRIRIDFKIL